MAGVEIENEDTFLMKDVFWKLISRTGSGSFTYKLTAICGLALTSDAIEVLSVANILPEASCDLKLDDAKKGWINSSVFIGMTVGSLLWGCMGDLNGRKKTLIMSLTANGLFNLLSSFAQSFEYFIIFRLLSGIGVGGSVPVLFAYIAEFYSKENRGFSISFISSFWAIGGIMASGLAWLIIPSHISWSESEYFRYRSWQWYLLICSVPALLSAFFFGLMPESPKFLYERKEIKKAKDVLRKMFMENRPNENLESFEEELNELGNDERSASGGMSRNDFSRPNVCCYLCIVFRKMLQNAARMLKQVGLLFAGDIRKQTILLLIIYNSMSFGYYGMIMWFPEMFRRMDKYNGSICIEDNTTFGINGTPQETCETPGKVYLENLIVLASAIPGNLLVIVLVNKLGRRLLLSSSLLLSGVSIFLIYALKNSLQGFILSCVFGVFTSVFWNVSNIVITEIYPSNLRSTGLGVCLSVCRISSILVNLMMGYFLQFNCVVPLAVTAILLTLASFLSWFLKKTENLDLK